MSTITVCVCVCSLYRVMNAARDIRVCLADAGTKDVSSLDILVAADSCLYQGFNMFIWMKILVGFMRTFANIH